MEYGIIGTGAIGLPIAKRIVNGGVKLKFYARRSEVIDELKADGAEFYGSTGELGAACDVVFLFVNTYDQCVECTETLLSTMKRGGIILIGATISPKQMAVLDKMCADKGITALASPVTGGVKGAREGTLTVILSGDSAAIEKVTPCIKTFGSHLYDLGEDVKLAHTMKSLVQLLVGINTVATAEVLVLGTKSGLDPNQIYETICNSAGVSRIFENRACTMIARDFRRRGTVNILQKDLKISKELALDANIPLLLGDPASRLFSIGTQMLDGEQDFSAIVKLYETWGNIKLSDEEEK